MPLKRDTIAALREYIERQAAFGQLLVDVLNNMGNTDGAIATAANEVTDKADNATDALANEPESN